MEVKDKVVTVEGLKGAYDNLDGKIIQLNSELTYMCNVKYKEVTTSTPDWVVVGATDIHYILAAQIYTANNLYVRILYNMGSGFVLQVCDLNGNKVTSGSYTIGIAYIPK